MNKLLLILFFFAFTLAKAQDTNSIFIDTHLSVFQDSTWNPPPQFKDTVPVIMLTCDTARPMRVDSDIQFVLDTLRWISHNKTDTLEYYKMHTFITLDTTYYNVNPLVHWQYGYRYTEIGSYYIRWNYLDSNKQPLRKSVIVWDHRQIEK